MLLTSQETTEFIKEKDKKNKEKEKQEQWLEKIKKEAVKEAKKDERNKKGPIKQATQFCLLLACLMGPFLFLSSFLASFTISSLSFPAIVLAFLFLCFSYLFL